MPDKIIINEILVNTRIGVPEEERRFCQKLLITVILQRPLKKAGKSDSIKDTVDYFKVYGRIHDLAALKPRKLLEHFAHEIAEMILQEFSMSSVEIEIKKFILPDTDSVSVKIKRRRKK